MASPVLAVITVSVSMVCLVSALMREEKYTMYPGKEIVVECDSSPTPSECHTLPAASVIECAVQCFDNPDCGASQYANETCCKISPCQGASLGRVSLQAADDTRSIAIMTKSSSLLTAQYLGCVGWWPLISPVEEKDICGKDYHLNLTNVEFDDDDLHPESPSALFAGSSSSYAEVTEAPGLELTSFSWMAKVFRMPGGWSDATLFNWVVSRPLLDSGSQIYLSFGSSAVVAFNGTCGQLRLCYPSQFSEDEWHTMAVVYDHPSNTLTIWVDGESSSTKTNPHCGHNVNIYTSSHISIGKAQPTNNRFFSGKIRCMSIYSGVVDYNWMHDATMPYCDKII